MVLRAFEDSDADVVTSGASDPLIPLITTVPTSGTRDDAVAYIHRQHHRLTQGAGYSFAIADFDSGEAVGQIGLWTKDIEAGRTSSGYWISPRFRRRGYARAALQALTAWALTLDGVNRVALFVEPWNEASWRTAEACGFEREGLLRNWEQVGSELKAMYAYSRIAPGAGR